MFFKNMVAFRLPNGWKLPKERLENSLLKVSGRTCGPMDRSVAGWSAPVIDGEMVHEVKGHKLIMLRIEEKILPGSVVTKELKKRCVKLEKEQGRNASRKELKEMREAIECELLPKAFVKERMVPIWIDKNAVWLGVEASSASKATEAIDAMRACIDDLPEIQSIITTESPSYVMRTWLSNEEATHGFSIDDQCELVSAGEVKASVKYTRHPLDGEDVHQHLGEGKLPKSLGVTYEDQVAFVFTEAMDIKKIELIDFTDSESADTEHKSEQIDAVFFVFAEVMSEALTALVLACGGESDDSDMGGDGE